ncbi:hypothetical protein GCM10023185_36340 [Hymenobacter saemangeumensis]|uniref:DinB-like domain-containing protein n=1 Tax=Hymenobacter saemangeumensis TaxID=1084522 RepID=A0ABP8IQJ8_9BACT
MTVENMSSFSLDKTLEILRQTPATLLHLTGGLSDFWVTRNEGPDTWSVYDVVGHLIHGDKTDWLPRVHTILSASPEKQFVPFDRFAQFEASKGKTLRELLQEFQAVRQQNLTQLRALPITPGDLDKTGIHPTFGPVTLRQLLSTWAVHDLDHIAQIARVMAKQYQAETGPWIAFLKVLNS